jgi:hypothetical protein
LVSENVADREAEQPFSGESSRALSRLIHGFQRFRSQKSVFRPTRWGKLAISFWSDGLVRERLDRRRMADVAAEVAAAIASG